MTHHEMSPTWQTEQITEFDADYEGAMGGFFDPDDDAKSVVGSLNAGDVFIYLFRRFGYPNIGWDGDKELVRYALTTPMSGVLLTVRPNVACNGVFGYMMREDLYRKCEDEYFKPGADWTRRCEAWVLKEHGIEIIQIFDQDNDKLNRVWDVWAADKQDVDFGSSKDATNSFFADQESIRVKYVKMYLKIEQHPERMHPRDMGKDSVLNQVHTAVYAAIKDLLRPVHIRDVMVDITGVVQLEAPVGFAVGYCSSAGYGIGNECGVQ